MGKRGWLIGSVALLGAIFYAARRRGKFKRDWEDELLFSSGAGFYDAFATAVLGGFYQRVAADIAAMIRVGSVLDVGCGPGHVAVNLALIAPDLAITGLDISPAMIDRATARAKELDVNDHARFEVGDVEALRFPDEQFDVVFSTFSLHHWPDPERGLLEVYRVTKIGGLVCIYDIASWLQQLEHRPYDLSQLVDASGFQLSRLETAVTLGPVPLVKRIVLRRNAAAGRHSQGRA